MSNYCDGEDCKCRVTREELMELKKKMMINELNECPSCDHNFGTHPSQHTSSTALTVSPSDSAKEERRRYESFRKKVLRREGYDPASLPGTIPCQICCEHVVSITIQAAHILDLNQKELLFEQYRRDSVHFPISISDVDNGMLVCLECHALFHHHISLKSDGSLRFSAIAVKANKYQQFKHNKAYVQFAAQIGTKDYPSAKFIAWAAKQKKKVIKRTLSFTSLESDDEDAPKNKKQKNNKHNKTSDIKKTNK